MKKLKRGDVVVIHDSVLNRCHAQLGVVNSVDLQNPESYWVLTNYYFDEPTLVRGFTIKMLEVIDHDPSLLDEPAAEEALPKKVKDICRVYSNAVEFVHQEIEPNGDSSGWSDLIRMNAPLARMAKQMVMLKDKEHAQILKDHSSVPLKRYSKFILDGVEFKVEDRLHIEL